MGSSSSSTPRFSASVWASPRVPSDEYGEGIVTHVTHSGPRASTAMRATSVESIPPESPMTTCLKPLLVT